MQNFRNLGRRFQVDVRTAGLGALPPVGMAG